MTNLRQDMQFGFRMLLKSRGLAAIAIFALALGVGANTAIFSVVNTVLLRPLPYAHADQLVWFWESQPGLEQAPFSAADFIDYQRQNQSFQQIATFHRVGFNLTGQGPAERVPGMVATPNFFSMLGVHPILGRDFVAEEGLFGSPRRVLLAYDFWQSHFGGDRSVVDRSVTLDNQQVQIIGVLPANFRYGGADIKVWVNPVFAVPEVFSTLTEWERNLRNNRETHYLAIIGRLKSGLQLSQAQKDIDGIVARLHQQYPVTTGHNVLLIPLRELSAGPVRQTLVVLLAVVGLVLLIACFNVANLLLSRAIARRREIAIRAALGAGRLRIVRQLLTESLLLSLVGGALGLALGWVLLRFLVAASPEQLPRVQEISLDSRVLVFTLSVSLLTGLVFGLAPALVAAQHSPGHFLKEAGRRGAGGLVHNRLRGLLVVAEVAFSLVLLVCAGLLGRSFMRMLEVNPGFRADHMVTMQMNFTGANYATKGRSTQFLDALLPRVAALPGVEGVAVSNDLPLEGDDTTTGISNVEARAPFARGEEPLVGLHAINPGFFQAMGIPLLRGREFSASDSANSTPAVVINQKLADTLWPGQDPLGKHINIMGDKQSEVVGVVGNVLHNGLGESISLETYLVFPQNPWGYVALSVRTHGDPGNVYGAVRGLVAQIDPELPVHDMRPMELVVAQTMASRRLTLWLVGAFAALALVLASVGIYGVMSYGVTERVNEIGVRMALGAQRRDVLRMVVGHGMRLTGIGLLLGSVAAFFAARAMTTLLFGVHPGDPLTYIAIALVLTIAALSACYVPARRATAVDPMVALRYE
jgi:putative ABC transport system permease protein